MSSILNSISSGDLWVCETPRENPIKEDSILELLQSPEIEFGTCPKIEDKLNNFNTGFGENNDLHFENECKKHTLKTPLYKENYLTEFATAEEKVAARKALGLYSGSDVVSMSLLTTADGTPSLKQVLSAELKQMRKGNELFFPYTSFKAVLGTDGKTLYEHLRTINNLIEDNKNTLEQIQKVSSKTKITSLGDVTKLLRGFKNGDDLYTTINEISQEMLRFNKTGEIK